MHNIIQLCLAANNILLIRFFAQPRLIIVNYLQALFPLFVKRVRMSFVEVNYLSKIVNECRLFSVI